MRILLVDSHMETGEIYKTLEQHFELETVDEGKSAIKLLRHRDIDAVVVRYILPDMDGVKLAAVINQKTPGLPVFVAVEDPGMDIWQEITKAKALVLPMPVDINKIKQIANNKDFTLFKNDQLERHGSNMVQDKVLKKDAEINAEGKPERKIPKLDETKIFIPEQPNQKKNSKLKKHEHQCQIITIFSPKGGVGKTTTVVNLAALAKTELDMRTGILEFTRQTGNVLGHFELNPTIDVSHWINREGCLVKTNWKICSFGALILR